MEYAFVIAVFVLIDVLLRDDDDDENDDNNSAFLLRDVDVLSK
jgi:hypothetical protein